MRYDSYVWSFIRIFFHHKFCIEVHIVIQVMPIFSEYPWRGTMDFSCLCNSMHRNPHEFLHILWCIEFYMVQSNLYGIIYLKTSWCCYQKSDWITKALLHVGKDNHWTSLLLCLQYVWYWDFSRTRPQKVYLIEGAGKKEKMPSRHTCWKILSWCAILAQKFVQTQQRT